jgi:hypothetical protein
MGRAAQNVYDEYEARRVGVLTALTTDVSAVRQAVLLQQCWHQRHFVAEDLSSRLVACAG